MHFQPIIETRTGRVFGFEALLRGMNGTEVAAPEGLFDKNGHLSEDEILRLDIACIGSALRTGRELAQNHALFVNLHVGTLEVLHENFKDFMGFMESLGVPTGQVVFEISEKTDPTTIKDSCESLAGFAASGIRMAIDDVGGSFSWLHHMMCVGPEFIKVDKAFVKGISSSKKRQAVVMSLELMCERMGIKLVAEGIEDAKDLAVMVSFGVNYVQGFFLGPPEPLHRWLSKEVPAFDISGAKEQKA